MFFVGLCVGFIMFFVLIIGINTYRVKCSKKPVCVYTVDIFSCKAQKRNNKESDKCTYCNEKKHFCQPEISQESI